MCFTQGSSREGAVERMEEYTGWKIATVSKGKILKMIFLFPAKFKMCSDYDFQVSV